MLISQTILCSCTKTGNIECHRTLTTKLIYNKSSLEPCVHWCQPTSYSTYLLLKFCSMNIKLNFGYLFFAGFVIKKLNHVINWLEHRHQHVQPSFVPLP